VYNFRIPCSAEAEMVQKVLAGDALGQSTFENVGHFVEGADLAVVSVPKAVAPSQFVEVYNCSRASEYNGAQGKFAHKVWLHLKAHTR
jgi:hypothetical protein